MTDQDRHYEKGLAIATSLTEDGLEALVSYVMLSTMEYPLSKKDRKAAERMYKYFTPHHLRIDE